MDPLRIRIVESEGVSPGEVLVVGSIDGARYTIDGGIEALSLYQLERARELIKDSE